VTTKLHEATIWFEDGRQTDCENVKILDNGWVKADVPTGGGGVFKGQYLSPATIERVDTSDGYY